MSVNYQNAYYFSFTLIPTSDSTLELNIFNIQVLLPWLPQFYPFVCLGSSFSSFLKKSSSKQHYLTNNIFLNVQTFLGSLCTWRTDWLHLKFMALTFLLEFIWRYWFTVFSYWDLKSEANPLFLPLEVAWYFCMATHRISLYL